MASFTTSTIILADDHPGFLAGLVQYFKARPDFTEVIETGDGKSCLEQLTYNEYSWAVIDLSMPGKTGFEVLEALLERNCNTKVIIMSMHADQAYADRARDLGAVAFIAKEDAISELDKALNCQEGDFYTSGSVGRATLNLLAEQSTEKLDELTSTERRVLKLLAQGLTSKEIGEHFCISVRTVQAHRRNMMDKLDLRGPNRLMEFAVRNVEKI